jgi:hypothetical protein
MSRPESRTTAAAWAVFAGAFLLLLSFDPLGRPVGLDPATWDYMSLALLDGRIPYRDIFLHKTPLAAFIGGLGAFGARALGFSPLDGAHLVFLLLGAAAPAVLLLLVRHRGPLAAAIAAAAWMLAVDQWLIASIEGVRPKVATTAFGLACLLAAERGRPATAGVFGGLATLCWQPGLAFPVAALWTLLRAVEKRRALTTLRFGLGAAAPAVLLLALLASVSALDDFFAQAVGFNLHYIDLHSRPPWNTITHLYQLLLQWNAVELLVVPVSVAALAIRDSPIPRSLVIASVAYFGLMLVNFQSWPDMILIAPMLGTLAGCGLVAAIRGAGGNPAAAGLAIAAGALIAAVPASGRARPPITYGDQAAFIKTITEDLQADDSVLTVGYPELLIHTGRHSVWRWPYMWFGVDRFAAQSAGGNFDSTLAELDRHPPRLMVVARRWSGPLRRAFEVWASERYTRTELRQYPHTVRPIVVYRRRDG